MRTIRALLALALVVAVAFPATAMGQSAGDEQYTDPFQGQDDGGGGGGGNDGSGDTQTGGDTQSGTLTDDGSTTEGTTDSGVAGTTESGGETGSGTAALPATGGPATMLAAIGAAFLLSGLALRRRA